MNIWNKDLIENKNFSFNLVFSSKRIKGWNNNFCTSNYFIYHTGLGFKNTNFTIGTLVIIYTVSGGTKAVSITQKQQMFVIMREW